MENLKLFDTFSSISIGKLSLASLFSAVLIFIICLMAIKIISRITNKILDKSSIERGLKGFIRSGLKIGLWALSIIIIAESLGIPTASLVALLSVAGLALSLALQDIMSNLFSGVTLLAAKPFMVGDIIEIDNVNGTIKNIGLFYTKILTADNKVIFMPNRDVIESRIFNFSSQPTRRVDINVKVSYENTTEEVKLALLETTLTNEKILQTPAPVVYLTAFTDTSVEYSLRVWVNNADHWTVFTTLNEEVRKVFNNKGIQMFTNNINVRVMKNQLDKE